MNCVSSNLQLNNKHVPKNIISLLPCLLPFIFLVIVTTLHHSQVHIHRFDWGKVQFHQQLLSRIANLNSSPQSCPRHLPIFSSSARNTSALRQPTNTHIGGVDPAVATFNSICGTSCLPSPNYIIQNKEDKISNNQMGDGECLAGEQN